MRTYVCCSVCKLIVSLQMDIHSYIAGVDLFRETTIPLYSVNIPTPCFHTIHQGCFASSLNWNRIGVYLKFLSHAVYMQRTSAFMEFVLKFDYLLEIT